VFKNVFFKCRCIFFKKEVGVCLFLPDRDASFGPAERFFSELGQEAERILESSPHTGRLMPPN